MRYYLVVCRDSKSKSPRLPHEPSKHSSVSATDNQNDQKASDVGRHPFSRRACTPSETWPFTDSSPAANTSKETPTILTLHVSCLPKTGYGRCTAPCYMGSFAANYALRRPLSR